LETSYAIELSDVAEKMYARIYENAQACLERGDESNSKVKQLRIVDEVLDRIIPHDPFAPDRALAGSLSGIFRIKKHLLHWKFPDAKNCDPVHFRYAAKRGRFPRSLSSFEPPDEVGEVRSNPGKPTY
jgi:hypothetical protein